MQLIGLDFTEAASAANALVHALERAAGEAAETL